MSHPHQWWGGITYAQHGDDLAVLNIFHRFKIDKPSYIAIGAHHPFDISNTALLYEKGWRGINVEPNPDLITAFQLHRPEDINLCVAVGVGAGKGKLYRLNETSGLNSLLPIEGCKDAIDVDVMTADQIVDKYWNGKWPDYLSIDAEGMDFAILNSIDYSRGCAKVICAEAVSQKGNSTNEIRALMLHRDYFVHSWAGSNMIFVQNKLHSLLY